MHWKIGFAGFASIALAAVSLAQTPDRRLCGTGKNADICFASLDRAGKVSEEKLVRLREAASIAIDVVSSPEFERELEAFYQAYGQEGEHSRYWDGFDVTAAIEATRLGFDDLHIDTEGGLGARRRAIFAGSVAREGTTDPRTGERNILLNRYRLNRPMAAFVNTYVHEASHKAGLSHRGRQNIHQKCEPPYVMGQIARKLADPSGWAAYAASGEACRFFTQSNEV